MSREEGDVARSGESDTPESAAVVGTVIIVAAAKGAVIINDS